MGASKEIDEDAAGDNARKAPVGAIRLHTQADWPMLYPDLQTAIRALIAHDPLWYWMERKTVYGDWETLISISQSRVKADYIGEDRS